MPDQVAPVSRPRRSLREPLLIFLAMGALIFAVDQLTLSPSEAGASIDITPALKKRIADQWSAQMGRPPTEAEFNGLIEEWIREEIYYREAMAMGLDRNDTIIRRRLAQKLTFLTEDLTDAQGADRQVLDAYYQKNLVSYVEPEAFSFEHQFFSSERREDAQSDAEKALEHPGSASDPFMLQLNYANRSERQIADLFGRDFALGLRELGEADADTWRGPIRSAYGWHIVRLIDHQPVRQKTLDEVLTEVERDLQQQRRRDANQQLFASLREKYSIRETGNPGQ